MLITISARHLVSTPCRGHLQHKMFSFLQRGNVKVDHRMLASSHSPSDKAADRSDKKHLSGFSKRPFVTLSASLSKQN